MLAMLQVHYCTVPPAELSSHYHIPLKTLADLGNVHAVFGVLADAHAAASSTAADGLKQRESNAAATSYFQSSDLQALVAAARSRHTDFGLPQIDQASSHASVQGSVASERHAGRYAESCGRPSATTDSLASGSWQHDRHTAPKGSWAARKSAQGRHTERGDTLSTESSIRDSFHTRQPCTGRRCAGQPCANRRRGRVVSAESGARVAALGGDARTGSQRAQRFALCHRAGHPFKGRLRAGARTSAKHRRTASIRCSQHSTT